MKIQLAVIAMFAVVVMFLAGCNLVPQIHATDENDAPLYYATDENGEVFSTTEKVDPVTGVERDPIMVYDGETVGAVGRSAVNTAAGFIPAPWSDLIALIGTGVVGGLVWFLRRSNRKKLEALGVSEELITKIENNGEMKALAKADGDSDSDALKARVEELFPSAPVEG